MLLDDFRVYETNASIKIQINKNKVDVVDYQIKMVEFNSDIGLVPLLSSQDTSIVELEYDKRDKLSLKEYVLNEKNVNVEEIITSIFNTLQRAKKFLLYEDSFVIDERYVYIRDDKSIELLYIPVEKKCDVGKEIDKLMHFFDESCDVQVANSKELSFSNMSSKYENVEDEVSNKYCLKGNIRMKSSPTLRRKNKDKKTNKEKTIKEKEVDEKGSIKTSKKSRKNLKMISFCVVQIIVVIAFKIALDMLGEVGISDYIALALIIASVDVLLAKKISQIDN